MKITSTGAAPHEVQADAVVVGVWQGLEKDDFVLDGPAAALDDAIGGGIRRLLESGEIATAENKVTKILGLSEVAAHVVAVVGLGKQNRVSSTLPFRAAGAAAKALAGQKRHRVAFYLPLRPLADAVCGSMTGCQGQDIYRTEPKLFPFDEILWDTDDSDQLRRGEVLGNAVGLTRNLVNQPANEIYPESFAQQCVTVGTAAGFQAEVWDEAKLTEENCGSLLAVAKGSDRPPRLAIMRYRGGTDDQFPLALVGKGVTFDSGGLSLKPSEAMSDMKCDMAGAATVLGAMQAIATLKLPVNVVGLVGLVENMISGRAYKLGDVLYSRKGKTIEVLNTDAEGRLVLADVLNVAVSLGAERMIDLATLTGACVVALGKHTAGLMTNHPEWLSVVAQSAQNCGEPAWELPMFDEFRQQIKSDVADIKNIGEGRWGGAITAAKFLEEFVDEVPWVHIDIAGPSFADKPRDWIDGGASGCFVRTLVDVAESLGR